MSLKHVLHYYEPTDMRRVRLESKTCTGQALCSSGDGHQKYAPKKWVTCPVCKELLKRG